MFSVEKYDVIYKPKGPAGEYAELAVNLKTTCVHKCTYCYCPKFLHKSPEEFHREGPPKKDILQRLAKDCAKMVKNKDTREVFFSFVGDPFESDETAWMTHQAMVLLGVHGIKTTVLTKAPWHGAMRDIDMFKAYDISLGVSLVWSDDADRYKYEPNAESIMDRSSALYHAHQGGVKTWVSLEPVINPAQALNVIRDLYKYVDRWKVGIIQHDAKLLAAHDWGKFYKDVTALLDSVGADYYIKESLMAYAKGK